MEKISANIIIEILGRPSEHIKNALTELTSKLGNEKGVNIIEKKVHDPILVKDSKDLFTTFAEISVEFDSIANYLGILFSYMPSHIEIVHPENFGIKNTDLNELGNIILQRLHQYDSIAKKLLSEREIIIKKLRNDAPEILDSLFKNNKQKNKIESNALTNEKKKNKSQIKKKSKNKK